MLPSSWPMVRKHIKASVFTVQRFLRAVRSVCFLTNRSSNFGLLGWWSLYSGCVFRKRRSSTGCWSLEITRKKKVHYFLYRYTSVGVLTMRAWKCIYFRCKKWQNCSCYFCKLDKEQQTFGLFSETSPACNIQSEFCCCWFFMPLLPQVELCNRWLTWF